MLDPDLVQSSDWLDRDLVQSSDWLDPDLVQSSDWLDLIPIGWIRISISQSDFLDLISVQISLDDFNIFNSAI